MTNKRSNLTTAESNKVIQDRINKAVAESTDLISALESVGAMYGIPSTNILADPTASKIKVVNDFIVAPPVSKTTENTQSIVCAIGSVLDYISQRIDSKLDEFQRNNIEKGRLDEAIKNGNPEKGTVIGRYDDGEGGDIIAYNTGLVDSGNTPAIQSKIKELRQNGSIPKYNQPQQSTLQYFSDEDDISNDVNMNSTPTTIGDTLSDNTIDVPESIGESALLLDLIGKFDNTTNLGYDLLQSQGFDYVKPVNSMILESGDSGKKIRYSDIHHMKFDNKNILKAVKCFNAARMDQESKKTGRMDIDLFCNNKNYLEGVKALNNQFDASINIMFYDSKAKNPMDVATRISDDIKHNLTISKSKGFQMNGAPITILVESNSIENLASNEIDLFGQHMTSIILHEIFHNIYRTIHQDTLVSGMSFMMTMSLAANIPDVKNRRILISNFVETLTFKGKKLNKTIKKRLIKTLTSYSIALRDEDIAAEIRKAAGNNSEISDAYMDKLIKKMKKNVHKTNRGVAVGIDLLCVSVCIAIMILFPSTSVYSYMLYTVSTAGFSLALLSDIIDLILNKKYDTSKNYEEYYCDLFAGMYQLPVVFFVGPSKKKYTPNNVDKEKLKQLNDLERQFGRNIHTTYPTSMERSYASLKIAKELLKQDDLDPEMKKYCEWIVDNFSSLKNLDIDNIYSTPTFDPKEAEDLDKHLQDLIIDDKLVLTESFVEWLQS